MSEAGVAVIAQPQQNQIERSAVGQGYIAGQQRVRRRRRPVPGLSRAWDRMETGLRPRWPSASRNGRSIRAFWTGFIGRHPAFIAEASTSTAARGGRWPPAVGIRPAPVWVLPPARAIWARSRSARARIMLGRYSFRAQAQSAPRSAAVSAGKEAGDWALTHNPLGVRSCRAGPLRYYEYFAEATRIACSSFWAGGRCGSCR